ncbi:MAG: hypothetical protein EXS05_10455 [Planctomycetaceae bacterium]|nr:hypothetical protein [Planctomycetaceae bacterium]
MRHLNLLSGFFVDGLLKPFVRPWPALTASALVTAIVMLLIIRWTSSPERIRRAKNRFVARVLELVLFRDDAWVSLTAGGRILLANAVYLRTLLVPLAASAVPCLLVLSQLSCWFENRPLRIGESALVEVALRDSFPVMERSVDLSVPAGIGLETEALRIPSLPAVDWRVRARNEGADWIEVQVAGEGPVRKQIAVGEQFKKVSQIRTARKWWEQFLNPAESPIDDSSSLVQVMVAHPRRQMLLGSREVDWLLAFAVLTIVFGLVLKRPLRVQI